MRPIFSRVLLGIATLIVLTLGTLALALWWGARDTTVYASGFREQAFERLRPGMGADQVYALLGPPLVSRQEKLREKWCYGEPAVGVEGSNHVVRDLFQRSPCVSFDEAGSVVAVMGEGLGAVRHGMSATEVQKLLGKPRRRLPAIARTLHYTKPGGEGQFRGRIVAVDGDGRVSDVISYQYYD